MRVYISEKFSSAIEKNPEKDLKNFNEKINALKVMNETEIIESDDVFSLLDEKNMVLYAYNIRPSVYVLFTFRGKNKLVLLDEIELVGENGIKSLSYPDMFVSGDND